jgi:hypothetical protein
VWLRAALSGGAAAAAGLGTTTTAAASVAGAAAGAAGAGAAAAAAAAAAGEKLSFAECADLMVGLLFAAHKNPAIAAAQVGETLCQGLESGAGEGEGHHALVLSMRHNPLDKFLAYLPWLHTCPLVLFCSHRVLLCFIVLHYVPSTLYVFLVRMHLFRRRF